MGSTVQEANYFLRTVLYLAILAVLSVAGIEGWRWVNRDSYALAAHQEQLQQLQKEAAEYEQQLRQRDELIQQQAGTIETLETEVQRQRMALKFLKLDRRLARIEVLDQQENPENPSQLLTKVRFTELGPRGEHLTKPLEAEIRGDFLFIQAQVISFQDEFVEQGDELRGRAICRFLGMFGNQQSADSGISLKRLPQSPGEMTDFEKKLWTDFWDLANDAATAKNQGVRVATGSAPFTKVKPGASYRVEIRATGQLTIQPETPATSSDASVQPTFR